VHSSKSKKQFVGRISKIPSKIPPKTAFSENPNPEDNERKAIPIPRSTKKLINCVKLIESTVALGHHIIIQLHKSGAKIQFLISQKISFLLSKEPKALQK